MEVIKYGNTYKEAECKKCGALLSYCEADIIVESDYYEVFGSWHDTYREYIVCPECKREIKLKYIIDGKEQEL